MAEVQNQETIEYKKDLPKKKDRFAIATSLLIFGMGIITVASMIIFKLQIWNKVNPKEEINQYETYDRYYALITNDVKSEFWESVYEGARETGAKDHKAYVENFASDLGTNYTIEERVKMAIAADVDGIIIEGGGSDELLSLVAEATEQGIPVVTVREDITDAQNVSFVGCSEYDMGLSYGAQIIQLATKIRAEQKEQGKEPSDAMNVKILISQTAEESSQNLMLSGIREEVAQNYTLSKVLTLEFCSVDDSGSFTVEESIRDIFLDKEDRPDIIVCLTELQTNCAYQAVVDYNRVGETNIIGFYDSENILNEIKKEIIYSTVSMDTRQMGQYCVDALEEYTELGNVSEYYAVDNYVVKLDNLSEYERGEE